MQTNILKKISLIKYFLYILNRVHKWTFAGTIYKYIIRYKWRIGVHPDASIRIDGELLADKGVYISEGVELFVPSGARLILGRNCRFGVGCVIENNVGSTISIGNDTSLQRNCQIRGDVQIGDNCLIAPNVFISSGRHIFDIFPGLSIRKQDAKYFETNSRHYSKKVSIGNDCWIGTNVFIKEGVQIGEGCIIGANSVVCKNLEDNSIAVGSPAKVVSSRERAYEKNSNSPLQSG